MFGSGTTGRVNNNKPSSPGKSGLSLAGQLSFTQERANAPRRRRLNDKMSPRKNQLPNNAIHIGSPVKLVSASNDAGTSKLFQGNCVNPLGNGFVKSSVLLRSPEKLSDNGLNMAGKGSTNDSRPTKTSTVSSAEALEKLKQLWCRKKETREATSTRQCLSSPKVQPAFHNRSYGWDSDSDSTTDDDPFPNLRLNPRKHESPNTVAKTLQKNIKLSTPVSPARASTVDNNSKFKQNRGISQIFASPQFNAHVHGPTSNLVQPESDSPVLIRSATSKTVHEHVSSESLPTSNKPRVRERKEKGKSGWQKMKYSGTPTTTTTTFVTPSASGTTLSRLFQGSADLFNCSTDDDPFPNVRLNPHKHESPNTVAETLQKKIKLSTHVSPARASTVDNNSKFKQNRDVSQIFASPQFNALVHGQTSNLVQPEFDSPVLIRSATSKTVHEHVSSESLPTSNKPRVRESKEKGKSVGKKMKSSGTPTTITTFVKPSASGTTLSPLFQGSADLFNCSTDDDPFPNLRLNPHKHESPNTVAETLQKKIKLSTPVSPARESTVDNNSKFKQNRDVSQIFASPQFNALVHGQTSNLIQPEFDSPVLIRSATSKTVHEHVSSESLPTSNKPRVRERKEKGKSGGQKMTSSGTPTTTTTFVTPSASGTTLSPLFQGSADLFNCSTDDDPFPNLRINPHKHESPNTVAETLQKKIKLSTPVSPARASTVDNNSKFKQNRDVSQIFSSPQFNALVHGPTSNLVQPDSDSPVLIRSATSKTVHEHVSSESKPTSNKPRVRERKEKGKSGRQKMKSSGTPTTTTFVTPSVSGTKLSPLFQGSADLFNYSTDDDPFPNLRLNPHKHESPNTVAETLQKKIKLSTPVSPARASTVDNNSKFKQNRDVSQIFASPQFNAPVHGQTSNLVQPEFDSPVLIRSATSKTVHEHVSSESLPTSNKLRVRERKEKGKSGGQKMKSSGTPTTTTTFVTPSASGTTWSPLFQGSADLFNCSTDDDPFPNLRLNPHKHESPNTVAKTLQKKIKLSTPVSPARASTVDNNSKFKQNRDVSQIFASPQFNALVHGPTSNLVQPESDSPVLIRSATCKTVHEHVSSESLPTSNKPRVRKRKEKGKSGGQKMKYSGTPTTTTTTFVTPSASGTTLSPLCQGSAASVIGVAGHDDTLTPETKHLLESINQVHKDEELAMSLQEELDREFALSLQNVAGRGGGANEQGSPTVGHFDTGHSGHTHHFPTYFSQHACPMHVRGRARGRTARATRDSRERAELMDLLQETYNGIHARLGTQLHSDRMRLAESIGEVKPKGLSKNDINLLPVVKYKASGGGAENLEECCICMMEYETEDSQKILPCFHTFHAKCIDKWIKQNSTCPVCRVEVTVS